MSTRRNSIVFYGVSLPCDFDRAEALESDKSIDVLIDGMSGDYFLVGKKLIDIGEEDADDSFLEKDSK